MEKTAHCTSANGMELTDDSSCLLLSVPTGPPQEVTDIELLTAIERVAKPKPTTPPLTEGQAQNEERNDYLKLSIAKTYDDKLALAMHAAFWIAVLLALLRRLERLCLRVATEDSLAAFTLCYDAILVETTLLGKMANGEAPKLEPATSATTGHDFKDMIPQVVEVRNWTDTYIGLYANSAEVDKIQHANPMLDALFEVSDRSWERLAKHVNVDAIRLSEKKRVKKLLDPKFSSFAALKLVYSSFVYVKDIGTDWLAAAVHLNEGRALEAVLTLFFVHAAALWVAARKFKARMAIAFCTLLPIIPVANSWQLFKLGIAMADRNSDLGQRIIAQRRFKAVRSENAVLAYMRVSLEDLPQFVLQTQLLLRMWPDTEATNANADLRSTMRGAHLMIVLTIASSFFSICRADAAIIRNGSPQTISGVWGLLLTVATYLFVMSFHGSFVIILTLFLWQCPWFVVLPTLLAAGGVALGALLSRTCPRDEPFVVYLKNVYSTWTSVALLALAITRFALRPLDVFDRWSDVFAYAVEISLLLVLYALYTTELHRTALVMAAAMSCLWVAIFALDRKHKFL